MFLITAFCSKLKPDLYNILLLNSIFIIIQNSIVKDFQITLQEN